MPGAPADQGARADRIVEIDTGNVERSVLVGTDGIDDGIELSSQLDVIDVLAHLDAELHRHAWVREDSTKVLADASSAEVVRCHAVARQTACGRQPVVERDRGSRHAQQGLRGVAGRRTGAHYGDTDRRQLVDRRHRKARLTPLRNRRLVAVVIRVDLGVDLLVRSQPGHPGDRVDRARIRTRTAVDARSWIDVQQLGLTEIRLVGGRMNAVDRAHRQAGCVVATVLRDRERHGLSDVLHGLEKSGQSMCRRR
ncbi:unannotated protein [freshwater metagenome]|uniref:Unannotated protein n=1 Tax=freshwater metagenome TaxID=449393 RepID=A0A6J7E486_9ZZZZ